MGAPRLCYSPWNVLIAEQKFFPNFREMQNGITQYNINLRSPWDCIAFHSPLHCHLSLLMIFSLLLITLFEIRTMLSIFPLITFYTFFVWKRVQYNDLWMPQNKCLLLLVLRKWREKRNFIFSFFKFII